MELIKASHWTVRGAIEFDKQITLQGRQYQLLSTELHTSKRGTKRDLLVWEGTCNVCGCHFVFETTRSRFYPTATCPQHRPINARGQS